MTEHLCSHGHRDTDGVDGCTAANSFDRRNRNESTKAGTCSLEMFTVVQARQQRRIGLITQVARALAVLLLSSALWAGLMHWGGWSGDWTSEDQTTIGPVESIVPSSSSNYITLPVDQGHNPPSSLENSAPSTGSRPSLLLTTSESPSRFSTNRSRAFKSCSADNRPSRDCNNNPQYNSSPNPQSRQTQHSPTLLTRSPTFLSDFAQDQDIMSTPHFPNPIVYQYTMYYPGNIPLIITAGHGGNCFSGQLVNQSMTHIFKRIPNLDRVSTPITYTNFSTPLDSTLEKLSDGQDTIGNDPRLCPLMPLRDMSQGGRFLKDINTHSIALDIANAVACLVNSPKEVNLDNLSPVDSGDIPERCMGQGPWGDEVSEDFFPTPRPSPTDSVAYRRGFTLPSAAAQDPSTASHKKQSTHPFYVPHVVVFRVHRKYVDVNRDLWGENAIAKGSRVAKAAWREYHDVIDHVKKMAMQQGSDLHRPQCLDHCPHLHQPLTGQGLLLDIHGHSHSSNLIEIGYLWNTSALQLSAKQLDEKASELTSQSSIKSLIMRIVSPPADTSSKDSVTIPLDSMASSPPSPLPTKILGSCRQSSMDIDTIFEKNKGMSLSTLLWGKSESLGGMLESQGLGSLPSPKNPRPCDKCAFYSGGYTITRHGSLGAEDVDMSMDAIQLEFPRTLRQVDKMEARLIAMKVGRAVVGFMERYYGGVFTGASANSTDDSVLVTQFPDNPMNSPQTNTDQSPMKLPLSQSPQSQGLSSDELQSQQLSADAYSSLDDSGSDSQDLHKDRSDIDDEVVRKEDSSIPDRCPKTSPHTSRL
ncbi:hypothetical protein BGW38_001933 [Lunasporangiospora selenospora]|uniref:Uncharacterized protein n=1 Tax=Lunasporangiospora selenospora TaxID=979761 RepID=A0A9P6G125_9FUNG|nr:hypothetical protein BGW38_001933 [Lunasporangiospora selenospora]